MRAKEFIVEGRSHPVIVVDVQPEYCGDNHICERIIHFVNDQTGPILMFVNAENMGQTGDTVQSIKAWWDEQLCPDEERYFYDEESDEYIENPDCPKINWNRFEIVDKGYGYLRSWMDMGTSPAAIIRTIREMYQQKVDDSRELFGGETNEEYIDRMQKLLGNEFKEYHLDDPLIVNWISVAQLKRFNGAYIVGGGREECLREVELLMNAFNIKYKRIDSLVY